jgi:hypothetical protein
MLTGTLLGLLIAALTYSLIYVVGQNRVLAGQFKKSSAELYDAQVAIGRFVALEQHRQKMKEDIVVNFTEEQITHLGTRISARIQTVLDSQRESALIKMN